MKLSRGLPTWAAAILLLVASPATAAPASLIDQLEAVVGIYQNTLGDPQAYVSEYPRIVGDGLNGAWLDISVLKATDPASATALISKVCQTHAVNIVTTDPTQIRLIRGAGTAKEVTTTFTTMGGDAYSESTPSKELLNWMGINADAVGPDAAFTAIALYNGVATMLRLSPDILIIQNNYRMPTVLGRCPTA